MKNTFDLDIAEHPPRRPIFSVSYDRLSPTPAGWFGGSNELARTLQKVVNSVKEKFENYFSNSPFSL